MAEIINFEDAKKSLEKKTSKNNNREKKTTTDVNSFKRRPYFLYLYNGALYIGYEGQHTEVGFNLVKAISVNVTLEDETLQIIPSQIYPYHLLTGERDLYVPSLNIHRSQVMLNGSLNEKMAELYLDIIGDTDKENLSDEKRLKECIERQDFAKMILDITEKKTKKAKILPFEKPI